MATDLGGSGDLTSDEQRSLARELRRNQKKGREGNEGSSYEGEAEAEEKRRWRQQMEARVRIVRARSVARSWRSRNPPLRRRGPRGVQELRSPTPDFLPSKSVDLRLPRLLRLRLIPRNPWIIRPWVCVREGEVACIGRDSTDRTRDRYRTSR